VHDNYCCTLLFLNLKSERVRRAKKQEKKTEIVHQADLVLNNKNAVKKGRRAHEKLAFFDIILGNFRGINTSSQVKALNKKKMLLAGFSSIKPELKSAAKVKVLTETKACVNEV
jgi:hypothetical protein